MAYLRTSFFAISYARDQRLTALFLALLPNPFSSGHVFSFPTRDPIFIPSSLRGIHGSMYASNRILIHLILLVILCAYVHS